MTQRRNYLRSNASILVADRDSHFVVANGVRTGSDAFVQRLGRRCARAPVLVRRIRGLPDRAWRYAEGGLELQKNGPEFSLRSRSRGAGAKGLRIVTLFGAIDGELLLCFSNEHRAIL